MDKIFNQIIEHQKLYSERIYLVASENSPSFTSRLPFLSDIANRYFFPMEKYKKWGFPGGEQMENIRNFCETKLRKLTGSKFVNLKPISGVNCMTLALAALTEPGDVVATLDPKSGGHHITKHIAERFGLRVTYLSYYNNKHESDPDFLLSGLKGNEKLIYLDQAHVLFPIPVEKLKSKLPDHTKIYYDGSHLMSLIFGKQMENPLEKDANFLGGSTHKTIPGPHKGFIATNDQENFDRIEKYADIFISHDHEGDIASLAMVLQEMDGKWENYARQIVKNAKYLGQLLQDKGFRIAASEREFTQTHQLWIDVSQLMDPCEAVAKLARCNIIVNSVVVPSFQNISIRIGIQELTYLGGTEETIENLADIFEKILLKKHFSEIQIKTEVKEIKQKFMPKFDEEYYEKFISLFKGN